MRDSPIRPAPAPRRLAMPTDSSVNQGNFILKKGAGDIWKPAFDGTPTTVRIYPGLSPDNPANFDPWRFDTTEAGRGMWYYPVTVAMNIGNPGKSFVLFDPQDDNYDPQMNPVWMLYNALDRAVRDRVDRQGWAGLMKGSSGRGALLERPKNCVLTQAAILSYKNKVYNPPKGGAANDGTVFFLLTPSARDAMMQEMDKRIEGPGGEPGNIASMYVHGDPISLDAGQYVTFYKIGHDPRQQAVSQQAPSFGASARSGGGGGQDNDQKGYGCFLSPTFNGMPARLREVEPMVRQHVKPFWEAVRVEPVEVQVRWLEEAFRNEADALVYALDDAYGRHFSEGYRSTGLDRLGRGRPQQGNWAGGQPSPPAQQGWGAPSPQANPYGPPAAPQQSLYEQIDPAAYPPPQGGESYGTTEQQAEQVFSGSHVPQGYAPQQPAQQGWGAPAPQEQPPAQQYAPPTHQYQPPAQPTHQYQQPPAQQGWGAPAPQPQQPPQQPQGGWGGAPQQAPPHQPPSTPDVPRTGIQEPAGDSSYAPVPPTAGSAPQQDVTAALQRARDRAQQRAQAPRPAGQ